MFDSEIQAASTGELERLLASIGFADGIAAQDLGIRVAKELRRRRKFATESQYPTRAANHRLSVRLDFPKSK